MKLHHHVKHHLHRHLKKAYPYFLPHPETHTKAHLLSWHFLLIYVLIFFLLRSGIDLVNVYKPGVLGVGSNINVERVVEQTNVERQKSGLSPLKYNSNLSQAAVKKAQNMFEENYWAHYSPSGKDPWGFIRGSGYRFSYAGENLARNFQNSDDVVRAWMNSPSHRENILNPRYQEIGVGVMDGVLQGQQTTLVVQMFGTPYQPLAFAPQSKSTPIQSGPTATPQPQAVVPTVEVEKKIAVNSQEVPSTSPIIESQPILVAGAQNLTTKALFDPFVITKIAGISLVSFIALLLLIDFLMLKKRGVFRISSHHLAHLSFLGISGASLILSKAGEVL